MRSSGPQVKNRAPAPIQITAEQLLREVSDNIIIIITIIIKTNIITIGKRTRS